MKHFNKNNASYSEEKIHSLWNMTKEAKKANAKLNQLRDQLKENRRYAI